MKYEHKSREGKQFIIYGLICPRTRQVRYVGQTSAALEQRTHGLTPAHFQGRMRDWLESLSPDRPIAIVLEEGVNRTVRLKSSWRMESKGNGKRRFARLTVWYSTVRETIWQKRFRRTLFNETPLESPEVAALLYNPPLPWSDTVSTD